MVLNLNSLFDGRVGLTASEGGHLAEAAVVAFQAVNKSLPCDISFSGETSETMAIVGPELTHQLQRTYADTQEATEWGASGLAALAIETVCNLTVIQRSPKNGKGFDYYLFPIGTHYDEDDMNFLGHATHQLEVSGTIQSDEGELMSREKEKINRFKEHPPLFPAYIVVVDFFRCRARLKKYV